MRSRTSTVAVLAMLGITLTACGSGAADVGSTPGATKTGTTAAEKVYADLSSKGGARAAALAGAKKEGELTLYTSMNEAVATAVTQAFTKQFGIKVNLFRGSSETILQRVLQESQASHPGADAVETNFLEMQTLHKEGLLGRFSGKVVDTLPATAKFDGWTADRFNVFLPAWNTDKVKPGEEPKSWADLADPKWKGRMEIELSDSDWYENLTHYWLTHGKSQQQVDKLWQGIRANATTAKGHAPMMDLLAAGQTALDGMNYSFETVLKQKQGAHVAYKGADGTTSVPGFPRPNGVGLDVKASHPNAAWLFYDWLLTDGQQVLVAENQTPVTKVKGDTSLDGVTLVPFDVKTLSKDASIWDKKYDQLLRGVKAAPQH